MIHQRLDRARARRRARTCRRAPEATFAEPERRGLRVHVSERHLRQAHVGSDQVDQALVSAAPLVQLHARELKTLLEDLGRVGRPGPGPCPPTSVQCALEAAKATSSPPSKIGTTRVTSERCVPAAGVGIVGDDQVAGSRVQPELLERRADGGAERAEEARDPVPLGDEVAVARRSGRGEVEHLVDDRALRGALERDEHLVADRRPARP